MNALTCLQCGQAATNVSGDRYTYRECAAGHRTVQLSAAEVKAIDKKLGVLGGAKRRIKKGEKEITPDTSVVQLFGSEAA